MEGQEVIGCSCFSSLPHPAPNPCEANGGRGPCSHLCLINYNRTVSCACPHLMKLQKDNTTCYGRSPSCRAGGHEAQGGASTRGLPCHCR